MQFSLDIEKFAEAAAEEMQQFVVDSVIYVFNGVVVKSPVDTGKFRANWNVSLIVPNYVTRNKTDRMPLGSPPSGEKMAAVREVLSRYTGSENIYISNGLPYAARLENGYSRQAPAGMVDLTLIEYKGFAARKHIERS